MPALLHSGATWLCKTFSVPDLVLNDAALAFILELDDAIFQTIVPIGTQYLARAVGWTNGKLERGKGVSRGCGY